MRPAHLPAPLALHRYDQLHTLVENRTVYTLDAFELNVFETHQAARISDSGRGQGDGN